MDHASHMKIDNSQIKSTDSWATSSSRSSSARVLPDEILAHILELGVMGQEERHISPWSYSFRGLYDYQLSISHVSRQFRCVAVNNPRLWTLIHLCGALESQVAYLETCLERSGSLPCTIVLDFEEEDDIDYPNPVICRIMTLVNSNIYRLERFYAKFCQVPILHQVMGFLNKPAPRLTTLELSYTAMFSSTTRFPTRNDFQFLLFDGKMPMLTTILLEAAAHTLRWPGYNLENLTVLGLKYEWGPVHQKLRTLLNRTPLLHKLSIRDSSLLAQSRPIEADSFVESKVELKSLELLEMVCLKPVDAKKIISYINAPNLKSLILAEIDEMDDMGPITLFDQILGPPLLFPNLSSLMLAFFQTNDKTLAKLLYEYPNLETLWVYGPDPIFKRSNYVWLLEDTNLTGGSRLCPNLKTLRCAGIKWEDIRDVLTRRAEANIPLPKLQLLEPCDTPNPSTVRWLQQNTRLEILDLAYDDF